MNNRKKRATTKDGAESLFSRAETGQPELKKLLNHLIATWENEVVEFKQAGKDYSTDKIGAYFSALANEANLRGQERAWLVFGVNNQSRQIVGSDYRLNPERLQSTKMQIAENTEPSVTFRNIHQRQDSRGRVVLFEVPAAPRGMPIAWKGHYYARAGESLTHLGLDKLDEIRQQTLAGDRTPRRYRNAFLAQAMAELNMIDTMGYGIYSMHIGQARRYFPMPDYDLSEPQTVKMTVYGSVVDPAYSRLLIQKTDLSLDEILALDRVQKKLPLADDMIKRLRRNGLIEGRKPALHVSAIVAKATASKADYIRTRAQDDAFYTKLIIDYLAKFGKSSREEIDKLLWDKLSDALNYEQKKNKIGNLLTMLRRAGRIRNTASRKASQWELAE